MRLLLHLLLPAALLAAAAADKPFGNGFGNDNGFNGNGPRNSYSAPPANGNGLGANGNGLGANGNGLGANGNGPSNIYTSPSANGNGFGANGNGPSNIYNAPSVNGNGFGANGNGFGNGRPSQTYGPPGGAYGQDPLAELGENIPGGGVPGVDYPVLAAVPDTGFSCDEQTVQGYYADAAPEAGCQVFHICQDRPRGRQQDSFLCPNGTVFNQQYLVCDWWFNFDCAQAESLYSVNEQLFAEAGAGYGYAGPTNGNGLVYGNGNGNGNGNGGIGNGYGNGRNGNGGANGNGRNGAPSYVAPSNGNGGNGNSYGVNGNGRNGNVAAPATYSTPTNGNGAPGPSYGTPL